MDFGDKPRTIDNTAFNDQLNTEGPKIIQQIKTQGYAQLRSNLFLFPTPRYVPQLDGNREVAAAISFGNFLTHHPNLQIDRILNMRHAQSNGVDGFLVITTERSDAQQK
jgi:hypothetical protein